MAAISQDGGDTDVVLYDAKTRSMIRNLTKGFTGNYQYIVAQEVGQLGRKMGRDLTFSPDGNQVAVFARKEGERSLVLINVLKGKVDRIIPIAVDQPLAPAWSPDGSRIAFSGHRGSKFDIYEIELASGTITNVTDDKIFDGAPTYSPDGKSIVFVSTLGDSDKLFRVDRDNTIERFQLTEGESSENDPIYSPDGSRLYFTSDWTGANNIFSLELATGKVVQHTNAVTGCYMPTVLADPAGPESLVYTAFWKGSHDLYRLDLDRPITEPTVIGTRELASEPSPITASDLPVFEPAIEVAVDDQNKSSYGGKKFFLENFFGGGLGISSDQTFIASFGMTFSDYLGDRRILFYFQSVASFRNFQLSYINQSKRLQRVYRLFDDEDFYLTLGDDFTIEQNQIFRQTGVTAGVNYPIDFNHRLELSVGFIRRELSFAQQAEVPLDVAIENGFLTSFLIQLGVEDEPIDVQVEALMDAGFTEFVFLTVPGSEPRKDDFPIIQASFVGDSIVYTQYGPHTGRAYRLSADYAPDIEDGGTLTQAFRLEYREYIPLGRRMNIAFRGYGYASSGSAPSPTYFGGLDTVRGFEFRSLAGNNAFFTNLELRFPLIDVLALPFMAIRGIRGYVFLDVAGAWFDEFQDFNFWDGDNNRLDDGVSSYGFGIGMNLFGLPFNWDFSKRWDFDRTLSDSFETSFWIGQRF